MTQQTIAGSGLRYTIPYNMSNKMFLVVIQADIPNDYNCIILQGCLGVLDDTFVNVRVPAEDRGRHRTRKEQIAMNVLAKYASILRVHTQKLATSGAEISYYRPESENLCVESWKPKSLFPLSEPTRWCQLEVSI
ncbi:hypothetical protein ACS0TY_006182 [Phlomoides rotata]